MMTKGAKHSVFTFCHGKYKSQIIHKLKRKKLLLESLITKCNITKIIKPRMPIAWPPFIWEV